MFEAIEYVKDKYEDKRTGLTIDEALEASVLGYRVRCPRIQAGAYIHYPGDGGWRIQFVNNGVEGSSSAWSPSTYDYLEQWEIVPLPSEVKRDAWGKPVKAELTWDDVMSDKERVEGGWRDKPIERDSWGRPIDGRS